MQDMRDIREMLKRNLGYKTISLLLAILFWLWVTNQAASTQTLDPGQPFNITLVTKNLPANSMVMTKLPSIRVRLEGYNPSVNVKDLYAYVDLTGSKPGEQEYVVQMDSIPNINIAEMTPNKVTLKLDTVQEKMFPLTVNITGTPSEGYEVGKAIVKPEVVNVRGPESLLASVSKAIVEVSVAGATDTVTASRPVLLRDAAGLAIFGPDPTIETLTANPSNIDIIVPVIAEELANKMVPLKVLSNGTPAQGMVIRSLEVIPQGVQVYGPEEALRAFDSLNIGPVDVSGISADKTFEISSDKINLPSRVTFGAKTTFTIIAKVGSAIQEKTLSGVPVTIRNIPADLEINQGVQAVNITVKALPEVLNDLEADQLSLWVDANGLKAGNQQDTQVYWQLPAGVEMVSVPKVSFSLKEKVPPGL